MARLRIRHFVEKTNRDGTVRRYWQPSRALRQMGWETVTLSPTDQAAAIAEAQRWNARLDAWRATGGALPAGPDGARPRIGIPTVRSERGTLGHLIDAYERSHTFAQLAPATRATYAKHLRQLRVWAGPEPIASVTPAQAQKLYDYLMGREDAAVAAAGYRMKVLKLLFRWGMTHEPFDRMIPSIVKGYPVLFALRGTAPRVRVATLEEEAAFVAAADRLGMPEVADAFIAAVWTGQRPSDVLSFTMPVDDGDRLVCTQKKTGTTVSILRAPALVARTQTIRARHGGALPLLLVTDSRTGEDFELDNFRRSRWNRVRDQAAKDCPSCDDLRFQDLRDTAVTRLAMAKVDLPGMCAITGHSLKSAYDILRHYLDLNEHIADAAIRALVTWYEGATETAGEGEKLDASADRA